MNQSAGQEIVRVRLCYERPNLHTIQLLLKPFGLDHAQGPPGSNAEMFWNALVILLRDHYFLKGQIVTLIQI